MTTFNIQFKDTDLERVRLLLDFVKSLDFVQSVQPVYSNIRVPKEKKDPARKQGNGFLALDEIKGKYPNEWVLLGNAEKEGLEIKGGIVLAHDPDKRAWALKGREIIGKNPEAQMCHFFTGELPKRAHIGYARLSAGLLGG